MGLLKRELWVVDGENLVRRFEAMLNDGWVPLNGVSHVPGAFVWRMPTTGMVPVRHFADVLRVSYFTSVIGDEAVREQVRDRKSTRLNSSH